MAEHGPSEAIVCPDCHGDGEIGVVGYSINPSSGLPVPDPQEETSARCPRCHGDGTVPMPSVLRMVFCSSCGEMLGVEDHIRIRAEHFQGPCRGMRFERYALVTESSSPDREGADRG